MAGEEKAQAQLMRLSATLSNMGDVQEVVLREIYEESQRLVPVDKGDLKASGKYDTERVEYGTDHAVHIEFGTVKMNPQPYLRPAVMNQLQKLARLSADEIQEKEKEAI